MNNIESTPGYHRHVIQMAIINLTPEDKSEPDVRTALFWLRSAQFPTNDQEPAPYSCKFCGRPSWIDPSDQSMPPDICHDSDHGEPEQEALPQAAPEDEQDVPNLQRFCEEP